MDTSVISFDILWDVLYSLQAVPIIGLTSGGIGWLYRVIRYWDETYRDMSVWHMIFSYLSVGVLQSNIAALFAGALALQFDLKPLSVIIIIVVASFDPPLLSRKMLPYILQLTFLAIARDKDGILTLLGTVTKPDDKPPDKKE